jgi:peptidoglycan hydrolase-like protein with peptidoglycan-binding domain
MSEPVAKKHHYGFDPKIKQQQEYLMALGFDLDEVDGFKGPGTQRVIAEFRALYLPDTSEQIQDTALTVVMEAFAKLAHQDAARYGIDQGVAAAIRLGSMRTGVDLSYLMKLAATESSFNPASEATTSSAAGLYQFTKDTWLNTLKRHGAKYGIVASYASKIRYSSTRVGPFVRDEGLYRHLLDLRRNPRLAALMAAEKVRDHQQKLVQSLNREPAETDLYLAHFLGINNAITFLQSLQQRPDTHAVELFPRAARSNHDIFQPRTCAPRTVDEVYALLDEKLSSRHYDEFAAN